MSKPHQHSLSKNSFMGNTAEITLCAKSLICFPMMMVVVVIMMIIIIIIIIININNKKYIACGM